MLNPAALAGMWGFAKGLVAGRPMDQIPFGSFISGPVVEEMMFRAPQLHPALSSAAFAAAHLTTDMIKADPGFSAYRFAEVFAGGLMYDQAFKKWGLFGAIGTHALHNVMTVLGGMLSPFPRGAGAYGRIKTQRRYKACPPRHRCNLKR